MRKYYEAYDERYQKILEVGYSKDSGQKLL